MTTIFDALWKPFLILRSEDKSLSDYLGLLSTAAQTIYLFSSVRTPLKKHFQKFTSSPQCKTEIYNILQSSPFDLKTKITN